MKRPVPEDYGTAAYILASKRYIDKIEKDVEILKRNLSIIKDCFYTNGETYKEQVLDLKAIASNVLTDFGQPKIDLCTFCNKNTSCDGRCL